MLETLLNGGPFMMVLLIIVGSIIFISVKNIKEPYNTNGIVESMLHLVQYQRLAIFRHRL
jgi:hypothetical protein